MTISDAIRRRPAAAAALLVLCLVLVPAGCRRHRKTTVRTIEEAPALSTVVATADPQAAAQLLSGFYGVEQNAWRWTGPRFSVLLRPPRGAATRGAVLQMKFTIPQGSLEKLKSQTISASVNGSPVPPETYTQAGQLLYSRDVPASLLGGDVARVDFSLDKTMAPGTADRRELGIVATTIGFQAK